MPNTYSQINIQTIFAVKDRENFITRNFRDDLHRYLSGILQKNGAYPLSVGGWLDHVHLFFELPLTLTISDLMRIVKSSSSKWINENNLVPQKFAWQEGYGAFSYSKSQRDNVISYIVNQEEHHKKTTFREEYMGFLKKFEVEFEEDYLFEFYSAKRELTQVQSDEGE